MRIVALDIETTGLNPDIHQIIECAIGIYDTSTKERKINSFLVWHEQYIGESFALSMNKRIFDELNDPTHSKEIIIGIDSLWEYIMVCLHKEQKPITLTGKNIAGFDLNFLKRVKDFDPTVFHHRVLDIGSLYFDPVIDKKELPSLSTCKKRAGLNEHVSHCAKDDVNDVIDCIEKYYKL
jgi:oligoribonuclease